MTRTPDEIKKGLAVCSVDECHGQHTDCPYHPELMCIRNICRDALALIQRLEAKNAELLKKVEQLQAERDALREGLKVELGCYVCKHFDNDAEYVSNDCMDCGKHKCNWEWRGVQREE